MINPTLDVFYDPVMTVSTDLAFHNADDHMEYLVMVVVEALVQMLILLRMLPEGAAALMLDGLACCEAGNKIEFNRTWRMSPEMWKLMGPLIQHSRSCNSFYNSLIYIYYIQYILQIKSKIKLMQHLNSSHGYSRNHFIAFVYKISLCLLHHRKRQ